MVGISLVAATFALQGLGGSIYKLIAQGMVEALAGIGRRDWTADNLSEILTPWILIYVRAILPCIGVILAVGLAAGLAQSNFTFTFKKLAPDFSRINPLSGFARIFSIRTAVEMVKGLAKLGLVGGVAYRDVAAMLPQIPSLVGQPAAVGIAHIITMALSSLKHIGFGLLALGVADYGYQYWEFRKSMKMTKQEVKQEHREMEGNPELKQKQRQTQREMAKRRKALKDVPLADVIITNPTHIAIAIKFDPAEHDAPTVLAKGSDLLAQRMKAIAADHDVPMVENRPLARTLFATVDVGKTVPPELYQAVAEVLAFVYSLRRQHRRETSL